MTEPAANRVFSPGMILALAGVGVVLLVVAFAWRPDVDAPAAEQDRTTPPAVIPPAAAQPLPPLLATAYNNLVALQQRGRYADAAELYPQFLTGMEKHLGDSAQELSRYVYNYGLALKLSGQVQRCLEVTAQWRSGHPDALHVLLLEATTRAEQSIRNRVPDLAAHAEFGELLRADHHPRLRGLGVDPMDLYAQWTHMLVEVGQATEALNVLKDALAYDPQHRACREIQARAMLGNSLSWEAVPILRALEREESTPLVRALLATALVETGEAAEAWPYFDQLLRESGAQASPGSDWYSSEALVLLKAARSLNEIQRPAEAAGLLIQPMIWDPEHPEQLWQLAIAARALNRPETAEALMRRSLALTPCEDFRNKAITAQRQNQAASAAYYSAMRFMAADQLGSAIEAIEYGLRATPTSIALHREWARLHVALGRLDVAGQILHQVWTAARVPAVMGDLAVVQLRRGDVAAARQLLDAHPPDPAQVARPDVLAIARARLVLGDLDHATALLGDDQQHTTHSELTMLCRAELAIRWNSWDEAAELLVHNFDQLAGGRAWASALRSTLALAEHLDTTSLVLDTWDPSDLLDHPWLFEVIRARGGPAAGPYLERLDALTTERGPIFAQLDTTQRYLTDDHIDALIDVHLEHGARRKARQLAWTGFVRQPESLRPNLQLVQTLTAPEEIIQRLGAARRGLRAASGNDACMEAARAAALSLGIEALAD